MEYIELLIHVCSWFVSSTALEIFQKQESVQFIYVLLFLDLFIMTFLVIWILSLQLLRSNGLAKIQFHRNFLLMELLINFPVTLGVIGTLFSISIAVAQSEGRNLSDVMNNNFDAAVVTTVIGGLVYGYCFFLQAALSHFLGHSNP